MRVLLVAFCLMAVPMVARAEGAPPHYAMTVRFDPDHGRLAVQADITLSADDMADGANFLLGRGYVVQSLRASDGVEASLSFADTPIPGMQRISVAPRSGGPAHIIISYDGALAEVPYNAIGRDRVELSVDSFWYPVSENFGSPLTLDATLTGLPAGSHVASPDTVTRERGRVRIRRTHPSPDIAFTASPLFRPVSEGRLTIYSDRPDSAAIVDYRTNGAAALTYLEAWLGPLPGGRAVIAAPRRESGVGYSRPGYLVVADVGPLDPDNLWGRYGYVAHELSHVWWSNADFMSEDYWLVESTAEYVALRFMEARLGRPAVDAILEQKRARAARGGPILGNGRPSDDAVYARGPLLLVALEAEIGRDRLDPMLRSLAQRERLTTRDFLKALSETAGSETAAAMDARLRAQ